jgi:hypothetical protein
VHKLRKVRKEQRLGMARRVIQLLMEWVLVRKEVERELVQMLALLELALVQQVHCSFWQRLVMIEQQQKALGQQCKVTRDQG